MAEPTQLFPHRDTPGVAGRPRTGSTEQPLESPEILVINALLESGEFIPSTYGLNEEMLSTARKPWAWCVQHQQQTGRAPDRDLFRRTFPDVELLDNVDPHWAADQLRTAHWERTMRKQLQGSIAAINEGDLDLAQSLVAEAARPALRSRPRGMSVFDPASVDQAAVKVAMPVPYHSLQRETGGIGQGELWYLGARLGQGKSWFLPAYAVCAAKHGVDVAVMTAEMPKRQWIHRIHMLMAPTNKHRARMKDEDPKVRAQALDELPKLDGTIEVLDPSDIEMGVRGVRLIAQDAKLLVLDHVGLFRDITGKRAIDDWRTAAAISNDLKEIALAASVSVLAGAQVNREGEHATSRPPKVSQLAGTDALGQDADVALLMKRMGERAMMHETGKNRSGPQVRWYTRFEPAKGDFSEISKDEALTIQIADAERLGDI